MKNTLRIEVMSTDRPLTENEQNAFRAQLQHLMGLNGIESMCIEAENLYVEFNPDFFNLDSFKQVLTDIGFPLERHVRMASFHYAV